MGFLPVTIKPPFGSSDIYPTSIMTIPFSRPHLRFRAVYSLQLIGILLASACTVVRPSMVSAPKEEFRAAWIATVANIDWPKHKQDSVEKQQADYLALLDYYKEMNFNAVIVQIRTSGDALYPTDLAPWSRYLSGDEGKDPGYGHDPLMWMIRETRKRGMEFHAWLNPYRATMSLDTLSLSPEHDYYRHPEWMIKYGTKYYYNPALPEVQDHLVAIIEEVVERYPVDAIHFDDYFYPYRIKDEVFNDSLSYQQYALEGQSVEDFRRHNVNQLMKRIHVSIQERKPWVQFGISPFGVWRNASVDPRGSDTRAGQTNYDDLFADPITWMDSSWIDYLIPQVYWSLDHPLASHRKIVTWWTGMAKNTNLYIGNGPYKIKSDSDKAWENPEEIPRQVDLGRQFPEVKGHAYFSAKSLINHPEVADLLRQGQYRFPALGPSSPLHRGINTTLPAFRGWRTDKQGLYISLALPQPDSLGRGIMREALVYGSPNDGQFTLDHPGHILLHQGFWYADPADENSLFIPKKTLRKHPYLAITFRDLYGYEGPAIRLKVTSKGHIVSLNALP
jgi:uncharacterized lipoprotein YddW (UPF0748 family)